MTTGGLTSFAAEGSKVQVLDGNAYIDIPGIASWAESGGDAPTREIVAFEGVASRTGRARPQNIECEVSSYLPHHRAWQIIREAVADAGTLSFQLFTPAAATILAETASGITAALVKDDATVTFAGSSSPDLSTSTFAPGMVLKIKGDTKNYVIQSIVDNSTAVTKVTMEVFEGDAAPGTAVSAEVYSIIIPQLRRGPFAAQIVNADKATLRAEADLAATLTLQPTGLLPEFSIV